MSRALLILCKLAAMRSAWSIFVHVTLCLCAGIVPQKDYVLAERLVVNDSVHAAGMQGQPQSLDDMTDGQIEERFYQSVDTFLISMLLWHYDAVLLVQMFF